MYYLALSRPCDFRKFISRYRERNATSWSFVLWKQTKRKVRVLQRPWTYRTTFKRTITVFYPTCSISCELSEGKHGAPTVLESLVPSTGLGKREVISVWYNASYLTTSGPLHLLCLGNSVFSLSRSGLLLSSGSPSKCHLFREAFSGHPTQPKVTSTFSTFTFITTFCVYY